LVADNNICWNSVFLMIERTFKFREAINFFCAVKRDGLAYNDTLSNEDWLMLAEIYIILRLFVIVTKILEGNGLTIPSIIYVLYLLFNSL
ncbi:uncharacterized protein B0H64DRAFT_306709, partial [Chaetomium fimeti]